MTHNIEETERILSIADQISKIVVSKASSPKEAELVFLTCIKAIKMAETIDTSKDININNTIELLQFIMNYEE